MDDNKDITNNPYNIERKLKEASYLMIDDHDFRVLKGSDNLDIFYEEIIRIVSDEEVKEEGIRVQCPLRSPDKKIRLKTVGNPIFSPTTLMLSNVDDGYSHTDMFLIKEYVGKTLPTACLLTEDIFPDYYILYNVRVNPLVNDSDIILPVMIIFDYFIREVNDSWVPHAGWDRRKLKTEGTNGT
jgi:hypothetical protein